MRQLRTAVLVLAALTAFAVLQGCGASDPAPDTSAPAPDFSDTETGLASAEQICGQLIDRRGDEAHLSTFALEAAGDVYVSPDLGQVSVTSSRPDGLVAVCGLTTDEFQSTQVFATDGVLEPVLVDDFRGYDLGSAETAWSPQELTRGL